ncbi:MAG TPA: YkgJ family cysteine cluster protein [Alphaproteobacteria bacterium]|nr:YkgJ family cysteine cluster protein [Alphaproteobacteria bacterium]
MVQDNSKAGWGGADALAWLVNRGAPRPTEPARPPAAAAPSGESEIAGHVRRDAMAAIKAGHSSVGVAEMAGVAAQWFDRAWSGQHAAVEARVTPNIACATGCDWCCRQQVTIAPAEAIAIARHVHATFPAEALAALKARLAALDERSRGLGPFARGLLKTPCAFLVDSRCTIYDRRPLRCRSVFSRDVQHCRWVAENPDLVFAWRDRVLDRTPYVLEAVAVADAALQGLSAAARDVGLASEALDLTAALRIALETPDTEERYVAGEPVFAGARLPALPTAGMPAGAESAPAPAKPLSSDSAVATAAYFQAVDALRGSRTASGLAAAAAAAGSAADAAWAEARPAVEARRQPGFACAAGCAWCCHQQVAVAPAEAAAIAHHVRQNFPPAALAALKARLAELDRRTRGLDVAKRAQLKAACAFLEDGRCTIYAVRPLRCRGVYSRDADHCRWAMENPDQIFGSPERHAKAGPYPVEPARIMDNALSGLARALRDQGLAWEALELTAAVRTALEIPDATERYLAGEPVFCGTELPSRDGHVAAPAADMPGLAKQGE